MALIEPLSKTVVHTKNLSKRFDDVAVLDNVNIHVLRGEIYGFLGPNGAGKTTTMRILLGSIPPSNGYAFLFGKRVAGRDPSLFTRIGVVDEEQHFYEDMTAREYLSFFAALLGVSDGKSGEAQLEKLGLMKHADQVIRTFSHGMRQRLALARSLLHDPELLFLDEPVTGLDPHGIRRVRQILLDLKQRGTTIFISSHVLSEVERLANRVGILHQGRLLVEGDLSTLGDLAVRRRLIEVELVEVPAGARDLLLQLPFVCSVEEKEGRLLIETDLQEDHRAQVSRLLTGLGGVIVGMKRSTPSLEETFVSLTEENLSGLQALVDR